MAYGNYDEVVHNPYMCIVVSQMIAVCTSGVNMSFEVHCRINTIAVVVFFR